MDRVASVPFQVPLAVRLSQLLKSDRQTTVGVDVKVTEGVEVRVEVKVAVGRVPVGVAVGVPVKVVEGVAVPVAVGVKVVKAWVRVSS
jgi:hypothetical protein